MGGGDLSPWCPGSLAQRPGVERGRSEWSQCRDRKSKHYSLGHADRLRGEGDRMGQGPGLISSCPSIPLPAPEGP